METKMLRLFSRAGKVVIAGALTFALVEQVVAQQAEAQWPVRPVTVVVGYPPGGATDVLARMLSEKLGNKLGQAFVVVNRPGAGGGVAASRLKSDPPDGYTLMFGSSGTLTVAPNIRKDLTYDPVKDFTPISLVSSYPYFLVVAESSPIKTLDDFLKQAKVSGKNMSYASAGVGAVNHLTAEWFKLVANIDSVHVPYGGDPAAVADLITGRVDWAFLSGAAALPQVQAGKLRILASTRESAESQDDKVPTLNTVFKDFTAGPWNGVKGPAGMPEHIVEKLAAAIKESLNDKDVQKGMSAAAQYPLVGGPSEFSEKIKAETAHWANIIRTASIKVD